MILKTILVLLTLVGVNCYAQFGPQQIITTDANLAESVFAADIDGDGDMDVLSASRSDSKIAWYENTDGLGNFGSENIVASLDQTQWVRAADLDGDDDMDVLALSAPSDLIVWYENLDGLGTFSSQKIISTNVDLPKAIIAADIDGDNDMDVLSASWFDNKVAWYENTDGQGNFGTQQIISSSALTTFSVYAADIDGDLDMDVLATSGGDKRLYWYENLNGLGNFGPGQIIVETPNFGGFVYIFAIDIDGDDDMDVLSAEFGGNRLAWYENTDGLGSFGPQQVIDAAADGANMIFAMDLDGDTDMDVLSALAVEDEIVWYENLDGLGGFGSKQIIASTDVAQPRDVFAIDLDGDTDMDVLSASLVDDKVAWYENLKIFDLEDYMDSNLAIYPNPSKGEINIDLRNEIITQIEIYNLLGEKLRSATNNVEQIDIADLQAGIYLLKIYTENGSVTKKIIKN